MSIVNETLFVILPLNYSYLRVGCPYLKTFNTSYVTYDLAGLTTSQSECFSGNLGHTLHCMHGEGMLTK